MAMDGGFNWQLGTDLTVSKPSQRTPQQYNDFKKEAKNWILDISGKEIGKIATYNEFFPRQKGFEVWIRCYVLT